MAAAGLFMLAYGTVKSEFILVLGVLWAAGTIWS